MSIQADLVQAHRLIMEASEGPSLALVKGKANRALLIRSVGKLRAAADILERIAG